MSVRPEGVRLVHADGTSVILELAHSGVDAEGYDRWSVATPVDFAAGDNIQVDDMPEMCCIEFPLQNWSAVA
jgi:hypothetical protein